MAALAANYKALRTNAQSQLYLYILAAIRDISARYKDNPYSRRENYDTYVKRITSTPTKDKKNSFCKIAQDAGITLSMFYENLVDETLHVGNRDALMTINSVRVTDTEDEHLKQRGGNYPEHLARLLERKRLDTLVTILEDAETETGLHYSRIMHNISIKTDLSHTLSGATDTKQYFRAKTTERFNAAGLNNVDLTQTVYKLYDGFLRALAQRIAPVLWHTGTQFVTKDWLLAFIEQTAPMTDEYTDDITDTIKRVIEASPPKKPSKPKSKKETTAATNIPTTSNAAVITAPAITTTVETKT